MVDFTQISKMKVGQKYTIVTFLFSGVPTCDKFFLRSMVEVPIEDEPTFNMQIKPLNAPMRTITITNNRQFVLWEGWVDPVITLSVKREQRGDRTMLLRWRRHDARYIKRAIESVPWQQPMMFCMFPMVAETFYDLAYISYNQQQEGSNATVHGS